MSGPLTPTKSPWQQPAISPDGPTRSSRSTRSIRSSTLETLVIQHTHTDTHLDTHLDTSPEPETEYDLDDTQPIGPMTWEHWE
jgi:hypothetical protein